LEDHNVPALKNGIEEVSVEATKDEVESAIRRLLSLPKPVDALFFASNKLSTFGLKYLNTLPLKVPGDLFLCSFDQSDATDLFYAPLTHIRQPIAQMGAEAVTMLVQLMSDNKKARELHLKAELVIRQSTGF
jgi:LacI family transcriptional regulator